MTKKGQTPRSECIQSSSWLMEEPPSTFFLNGLLLLTWMNGWWLHPAGAACVWDETDTQTYSLFKDHLAKNRNWNTGWSVYTHSPKEGHSRAGGIHSLGKDHQRITEPQSRKSILRLLPLMLSFYRWGSKGPDRKLPSPPSPRDRAEAWLELGTQPGDLTQCSTLPWEHKSLQG